MMCVRKWCSASADVTEATSTVAVHEHNRNEGQNTTLSKNPASKAAAVRVALTPRAGKHLRDAAAVLFQ